MMIKICGLTRLEDVEAAVRHGATAVGFNFWEHSPRYVGATAAAEISRALPAHVMAVGVFVNEAVTVVNKIADTVGLRGIQLHGDETSAYLAALELGPERQLMRVLHGGPETTRGWPADTLLLIDAHDPVRRGGTGRLADWSVAAGLARHHRVVLAGGLTPDNVAEAIATVGPFGVDVSSGVERSPGIKDEDMIRRFVSEARDALERAGRSGHDSQ